MIYMLLLVKMVQENGLMQAMFKVLKDLKENLELKALKVPKA